MSFDLVPIETDWNGAEKALEVRKESQVQTSRGKPPVWKSMFFCVTCQKEPEEIGHYGAAATTSRNAQGQVTGEDGYIHGYCRCHGAFAEFAATFDQAWAAWDLKERINVFETTLDEASSPLVSQPGPSLLTT